jgi:flavin-dependent dehydrogenase
MRWHKSDWEVETSRRVLRVKVVVGADGVQSAVRKFAGFSTKSDGRAASLLEVEFPAAKKDQSDQNDKTIIVDFSEMGRGLFGYSWIFPFVKNGQPHLRCGVFDNFLFLSQSKWKREKSLNQILHQTMERNGIEPSQNELGGWSLRCFRLKSPIATERLLLVGDAAGVDPLFGEGLSYSLQYGATAAQSIVRAFASENFAFSNYKRNFIKSSIGWNLVLRSLIANALARVPWLARSGVLDFFWRFCVLLFPREV